MEEVDFLALAQLRTAQGRPADALRLLTRLRGLAEAQGRDASLVEIYALGALAYRAAGDPAAAQVQLARALALAQPEGYVRSFVDLGKPMQQQLAAYRAQLGEQDETLAAYTDRLLCAFPGHELAAPPHVVRSALSTQHSALTEQPTPRELEVLGWINEGLSNEQIAAKLVVGLSTVKKHINNLYAKLQVTSRTQALKRARALGLAE